MNKATPNSRSKNMKAVKSQNTKIELVLRKALWTNGLRYRKNDKSIFGKPDIVFKNKMVVIFCDSEFWHGKDWHLKKADFKSNREFWIPKIERNIERDKEVTSHLEHAGWTVLRFWGKEIIENTDECVKKIILALKK